MPWQIRSLDEASARVRGAFRLYMPGTDSALKNNVVTVIGKVLATLAHELELRLAFLSRQLFISTATGQFLIRRCADVGIYRKPASTASGWLAGSGAVLTTYPAGLRFVSGNITYLSTAPATADVDGLLSVPVVSEVRGSAANRDADGLLALADPVLWPALGTQWTVGIDGLGGGADLEDIESLRARGLQRQQFPPAAGALPDYERIVRAVPGVTAAWAFRGSAPGSAFVFFLFAGRADSVPTPADVAVVQAAVDAQRLIRVDDSVAVAVTPRAIPVTINGLSSDTPDIRAAIETAIRAMFVAKCRPGIAVQTFTVSRSWIGEVISATTGETRHVLVAPSGDITLTDGQFPVLGAVTYGA